MVLVGGDMVAVSATEKLPQAVDERRAVCAQRLV